MRLPIHARSLALPPHSEHAPCGPVLTRHTALACSGQATAWPWARLTDAVAAHVVRDERSRPNEPIMRRIRAINRNPWEGTRHPPLARPIRFQNLLLARRDVGC
jgi:hypothetical protein